MKKAEGVKPLAPSQRGRPGECAAPRSRQLDFECRGEARLARPVYNSRVVKIDAATDGTEQRLPLEGKLAQRQLRLMRSKLKIITMGWYKIATFDLIRSGLSRTTIVEV